MKKDQLVDFKNKYIAVTLLNQKNICGNLLELNDNIAKVETDLGILQIKLENISFVNIVDQLKDLFVYTCKNQLLHCKGIRLISSKQKINWPCKYFKNYECEIRKVCNYNEIPVKIKNSFIDGMHSQIPVVGSLKQKSE